MPVVVLNKPRVNRSATLLEGLANGFNAYRKGQQQSLAQKQQSDLRNAQARKFDAEATGLETTNTARSGIADGLAGVELPNNLAPEQFATLLNSGGEQKIGDILGTIDAGNNRSSAVDSLNSGDTGIASGLSSIAAGKAINAPFVQNASGQVLNQFQGATDASSPLTQSVIGENQANARQSDASAFNSRQSGLLNQQKAQNAANGIEVDPLRAAQLEKTQLDIQGIQNKQEQKQRQQDNALDNAIFKAERTLGLVNDAQGLISGTSTGMIGALTSRIPGFDSFDLAQKIQTINSNLGIDELLRVKGDGGTFGALSDRELTVLQTSIANLNQAQNSQQFAEQLAVVEQNYQRFVQIAQQERNERQNPQGAATQEQPQQEIADQSQYDQLPAGASYTFQGETYIKGQ